MPFKAHKMDKEQKHMASQQMKECIGHRVYFEWTEYINGLMVASRTKNHINTGIVKCIRRHEEQILVASHRFRKDEYKTVTIIDLIIKTDDGKPDKYVSRTLHEVWFEDRGENAQSSN